MGNGSPKAADLASVSEDMVARFLQQHGYQVAKTESCWWFNEYRQRYMFYSFPAHRQVAPTKSETEELFRQFPSAVALRFIGPPEGPGKRSFIWARRKPYGLSMLARNTRPKVSKGLEHCRVRKLSFAELVSIGWEAHSDTQSRHKQRARGMGFDATLDRCEAYEAWGAFHEDVLSAYVVVLRVDGRASILINRSANSSLKFRPNYALVFSVVSDLLSREGIAEVNYGWDSLVPTPGLETFKSRMGFLKEPVNQRLIIRPQLSPILSRNLCRLIIKVVPPGLLSYRLQQLYGLCQVLAAD